jgi:ABC-2 type transport system ATP-binding protein
MADRICDEAGLRVLPAKDGKVLVQLEHGASDVAGVVRALDDAGIAVEALELVQPTLDDVFVAKTGYHLEAEEEGSGEHEIAGEQETAPA